MSENLKFFKGNEADLPAAAPSNAGSIYHCEDTGNTYLSNGDQMILFSTSVGKKHPVYSNSELFTNYNQNSVGADNAFVTGLPSENWNTTQIICTGNNTYARVYEQSASYYSYKPGYYINSSKSYVSSSYCHTITFRLNANQLYHIKYQYYAS